MAVPEASELVESAIRAATAYQRPDLHDRLRNTRSRLADPAVRVLVVGEFKQGKSQLVNALVSAPICPVDDDIATALPTVVRYAETASAALVHQTDDGVVERTPIPLGELAGHVGDRRRAGERHTTCAEVGIPRKLLATGMVLVDTPGVGGLGSAHGAATMAALAGADAVLLVSDAAQEYTEPELSFLAAALRLCPTVACVLSKTDLYREWRRIAETDRGHLAVAGVSAELFPVSSTLRLHALRRQDNALNEESGYPALVRYLREEVLGRADQLDRASTGQDVLGVCEQLESTMRAELAAQEDPEHTEELLRELTQAQARAAELKDRSARWQVTLNDGVADLVADIEHDLRDRLRTITREAEAMVDAGDPAEIWDQFAAWVHQQVAHAAAANFVWASERSRALAARVAELFALDGAGAVAQLRLGADPHSGRLTTMERPEIEIPGRGEKALSGLRGGYMGGLMFFMPLSLIPGLAIVAPFAAIGGALLLGRKQLRDEKHRALLRRRSDAKVAARKHIDEVQFQVGKDSRDMLREAQRELRDHYTKVAGEFHTSMTESVAAAQAAVRTTDAERSARIADIRAELARVDALADRARALAGAS